MCSEVLWPAAGRSGCGEVAVTRGALKLVRSRVVGSITVLVSLLDTNSPELKSDPGLNGQLLTATTAPFPREGERPRELDWGPLNEHIQTIKHARNRCASQLSATPSRGPVRVLKTNRSSSSISASRALSVSYMERCVESG